MTAPRRARQSRAIEKQGQILDAAVDLIFAEGVQKISHRQVAARAGVPVGSIGYYYDTRENLLVLAIGELNRRRQRAVAELWAEEPGKPQTPEATAALLLRTLVGGEPTDEVLSAWLRILVEGTRESAALRQALAELRDQVYRDLRLFLNETGRPDLREAQVNALVGGAVLVGLAQQNGSVREAVQDILVDLLRSAV